MDLFSVKPVDNHAVLTNLTTGNPHTQYALKATLVTMSDPSAITTTQTAGLLYTSNERDMLNAAKADITALRAILLALTDKLQAL